MRLMRFTEQKTLLKASMIEWKRSMIRSPWRKDSRRNLRQTWSNSKRTALIKSLSSRLKRLRWERDLRIWKLAWMKSKSQLNRSFLIYLEKYETWTIACLMEQRESKDLKIRFTNCRSRLIWQRRHTRTSSVWTLMRSQALQSRKWTMSTQWSMRSWETPSLRMRDKKRS